MYQRFYMIEKNLEGRKTIIDRKKNMSCNSLLKSKYCEHGFNDLSKVQQFHKIY